MRRLNQAAAALVLAAGGATAQDVARSPLATSQPWQQSAASESQQDAARRAKLIGRTYWVNADGSVAAVIGPFAASAKFNADRYAADMQIDRLQRFTVVGERVNSSLGYPLAADAWLQCEFDDGATLYLSQKSFERRQQMEPDDAGAIADRNPVEIRAEAERKSAARQAATSAAAAKARQRAQAAQATLARLPAPAVGMTYDQALQTRWGAPTSRVKTTTAAGETLMLDFADGRLYLAGGRVSMIQER